MSATELCELQVVTKLLLHVLDCTKVSLGRRERHLLEELRPTAPMSPVYQGRLLDATVANLRRGVDLVKQGQCANDGVVDVVCRLENLHERMNHDVFHKVHGADLGADWWTAGAEMVRKFLVEIDRLRRDVIGLDGECNVPWPESV